MSDGDGNEFILSENIDKDQMVLDCRINIGFMKGFGKEVVHWHKGNSSFSVEPAYSRESIEFTPCWVRFDLIEALRLCERERQAYSKNKQLYREKLKNQEIIYKQNMSKVQKSSLNNPMTSLKNGVQNHVIKRVVSNSLEPNSGSSGGSSNNDGSNGSNSNGNFMNINYLPNIDVNEVENFLESGYSSSKPGDNNTNMNDFFDMDGSVKKENYNDGYY